MYPYGLVLWLLLIVLSAIIIMYASESFEEASAFVGRNMPAGVRGATINAVASSMPELLTTAFFLLLYHDEGGFSAGIATCAGSAVFNAALIPAACMLAVSSYGVDVEGEDSLQKLDTIEIGYRTILRDGFFFLLAEALLIYFLAPQWNQEMTWWMGASLVGVYVAYFIYLMIQFVQGHLGQDDEGVEIEEDEQKGTLEALYTFDFRQLFFGGQKFTDTRAWVVLLASITVISLGCWILSESVMSVAKSLEIPPYFAAVILAAAATSVPDTFISVNDAMEGEYDDAVSNAIGSNIFDITFALALPLLIYTLVTGEPLDVVVTTEHFEQVTSAEVQELRIVLIVVTCVLLGIFLWGREYGRGKAYSFIGLYILWAIYVLGRALQWWPSVQHWLPIV